MQKSKMLHIDVSRNENGITMTLDRWMDANAQVDYICGHILVLPIVYQHHWTKSTKDCTMKTVFQTIYDDHENFSTSLFWKTVVT